MTQNIAEAAKLVKQAGDTGKMITIGTSSQLSAIPEVTAALATGADPLHLSLVFNIDHTNAMAYAHAARNLLGSPAGQE